MIQFSYDVLLAFYHGLYDNQSQEIMVASHLGVQLHVCEYINYDIGEFV